MRTHAPTSLVIATGLVLLAGLACDSPPPPPPPAPPPSLPDPASLPPSAAEEELEAPEVAYSYTPVGKRDPFKSIFEDLAPPSDKLQELQKFQLDQLKIVAIITGRATPYAMVEDPSGKGHTLTRGKLIGKNFGRVAAINPECVVVKEEYRDYTGRKVTNELSMCLPKPDVAKID